LLDEIESDVTVVGTGFGAAVAACRLSQAGLGVLVLERGRRFEAQDFPPLPSDSALLPETKHWAWQGDHGLWDVEDLEELVSVQAAGYGGGSLIYANVHLRPPPEVFEDKWPEGYGAESLAPYFDLAAYMLGLAPITESGLFHKIVKADQLRKAVDRLGRSESFFHPPLAVSYATRENAHGRMQKECNGCGHCCTGCPETAKNTLDYNYLAVAEKFGARVRTQCEVLEIEELADGAGFRLDCADHLLGQRRTVRTKTLFLCAGAVHSTRLLSRAKLQESGRAAQQRAGVGYFPNADALGIIYDTEHPQYPSFGPTITTSTVHWAKSGPTPHAPPPPSQGFFLVQDGGYAREIERMAGTLRAALWTGRNRLTRSGRSLVEAAEHAPTPEATVEYRGAPPAPSAVDAFLLAGSSGAFSGIASDELKAALPGFLEEIKSLVLMPSIVDSTIELALEAKFKRLPAWLRGWLVRVGKWFAYSALGSREQLADGALRAVLSGSGLKPPELAAKVLGYDATNADHRVVLLSMGRDHTRGVLHYDPVSGRLIADLDLFHLAPRYTAEELLMSDIAKTLGGELRVNPAWSFLGKPITVHSHGGCRMSDVPEHGVTDARGRVHGCPNLHISDGSILCASVGVNPSATIAAVAERNVLAFIREQKPRWPEGDDSAGALSYAAQVAGAKGWAQTASDKGWVKTPPRSAELPFQSRPLTATFRETMQGFYSPDARPPGEADASSGNADDSHPDHDEAYRLAEIAGRPRYSLEVQLKATAPINEGFYEDENHTIFLDGTISLCLPGERTVTTAKTAGTLELFVPRYKPYALEEGPKKRAQEASVGPYKSVRGPGNLLHQGAPPPRSERLMKYRLAFEVNGAPWALHGYKRMSLEPGVNAWRDTTSLFITLLGPGSGSDDSPARANEVRGIGAIHVDLTGFLFGQLHSVTAEPACPSNGTHEPVDPARLTWSVAKFSSFFFGSLQRIYVPEVGAVVDTLFHPRKTKIDYQRRSP